MEMEVIVPVYNVDKGSSLKMEMEVERKGTEMDMRHTYSGF